MTGTSNHLRLGSLRTTTPMPNFEATDRHGTPPPHSNCNQLQGYVHEIHKHIIESVHHRHAQVVLLSNWIQDSVPAKHSVVLKVKASSNT